MYVSGNDGDDEDDAVYAAARTVHAGDDLGIVDDDNVKVHLHVLLWPFNSLNAI